MTRVNEESGKDTYNEKSSLTEEAVPEAEEALADGEAEDQGSGTEADAANVGEAGEDAESGRLQELERELEKLRAQSDENHQRYLRSQADFDNFRRRSGQEKEEFAKYASAKLIERLLPIVDNLDRALLSSKQTQDFEALAKGVEMTFRMLDQVLAEEGLAPIESVGQPFNPEIHQAIMQVESDEHEEGIVVEEVMKGYKLKDKILRPAMVKVST